MWMLWVLIGMLVEVLVVADVDVECFVDDFVYLCGFDEEFVVVVW